jgi:hypothetical protein
VHSRILSADLILRSLANDYGGSSGPYTMPKWITELPGFQETWLQAGIVGSNGYPVMTTASAAPGRSYLSYCELFSSIVIVLPFLFDGGAAGAR